MADRELKYKWVWPLFIAAMLGGAAMMYSGREPWTIIGMLLIASPILFFAALTTIYYLRERAEKES